MLIERLEALCRGAERELVLVAPFVKFGVMERLLAAVEDDVRVVAVARWWPNEIAAGVSDLEVWELFRDEPGRRLLLRNDLHAKVYRADDRCLVGSANLTAKALGYGASPNLELLVDVDRSDCDVVAFEAELWAGTVAVDEEIYRRTAELVARLPVSDVLLDETVSDSQEGPLSAWVPSTRQPDDLVLAYGGQFDLLSSAARLAAASDLAVLSVPHGLSAEGFRAWVGMALLRTPMVVAIDHFIDSQERRFGEIRELIAELNPDADASRTWQTLYRWLLYFLPERYGYRRPNHSELISRIDPQAGL